MKVNYELADGQVVEVEVTEAQAAALGLMKTKQESYERKFKRRTLRETSLERLSDEYEWEPADESVNVQAAVEQGYEAERMGRAIACLTDKQQRIVRLYFYEGYRFREIAEIMGVSKSTVSRHYEYAKAALEKILKNF